MPIRLRDQNSRLGRVNAILAGVTSSISGTSSVAPPRTGVIAAQMQPITVLISGIFSPAPNRTGTIASTLAGVISAITGFFAPSGLEPFFSASNPSLTEGNAAFKTFTHTLTANRTFPLSVLVDYVTEAVGSATAGVDYVSTSGTKTMTAGQTQVVVDVQVIGDTDLEPDEIYTVRFSNFRYA